MNDAANGTVYDQLFLNQTFNRAEVQTDYLVVNNLRLTSGIGAQYESVEATRYEKIQSFTSGYAYTQADWSPLRN